MANDLASFAEHLLSRPRSFPPATHFGAMPPLPPASADRRVRFSVVVTSYNYRAFVGEALESALAQTAPPHEILVVDDGSTDGSADYIEEHYARRNGVRLIRQDNQGQLSAVAAGVRLASGNFVAFLDADDLWEPDYLKRVSDIYRENPKVTFVHTDMQMFGDMSDTYSRRYLKNQKTRDLGLGVLLASYGTRWRGSATSAITMSRAIAAELTDVPSQLLASWKTSADVCLVRGSDILGAHKYFLAEALTRYRAHGRNAWLNRDDDVDFLHRIRSERMRSHYRQRMQVTDQWLDHAKYEFKTRTEPTLADVLDYQRLVFLSRAPLLRRLEHSLSIWRDYFLRRGRLLLRTIASQPT